MRNHITYFLLLTACLPCPVSAATPEPQMASLAELADAEKAYYEKIFDYAMATVTPGKQYEWASYSGKGSIRIEKEFISKSGYQCRNFSETFTIHNRPGNGSGVGCKRKGNEGWCRLKASNPLTCAMEKTNWLAGTDTHINTPSGSNNNSGSVASPNVSVNSPNVNTNVNTGVQSPGNGQKGDPTAQGYADTVTGTAGEAAGTAASEGIGWFGKTFR